MFIENNAKVVFEFKTSEYFLVRSEREKMGKWWSLNQRIDRSEKGKEDDIAVETIWLTDEEAEECKKAGFTYIEL